MHHERTLVEAVETGFLSFFAVLVELVKVGVRVSGGVRWDVALVAGSVVSLAVGTLEVISGDHAASYLVMIATSDASSFLGACVRLVIRALALIKLDHPITSLKRRKEGPGSP